MIDVRLGEPINHVTLVVGEGNNPLINTLQAIFKEGTELRLNFRRFLPWFCLLCSFRFVLGLLVGLI